MDEPEDAKRINWHVILDAFTNDEISGLLQRLESKASAAARRATIQMPNLEELVKKHLPPQTLSEQVVRAMEGMKGHMHLIEQSHAQTIAAFSASIANVGQANATMGEIKMVATGTVGPPPAPSPLIDVGVFTEEQSLPKVELVTGITATIINRILRDPKELYKLSPDKFEEVVIDRLEAMGYEVTKVGETYQPDGGVDIIIRAKSGFPCCGAVQVKHHQRSALKTPVDVIQRMLGVLSQHSEKFNMGLIVTNTSYTNPGEFVLARLGQHLLLRDGKDVHRWIRGDFNIEDEQREVPQRIQLTPHLTVDLTKKKLKK